MPKRISSEPEAGSLRALFREQSERYRKGSNIPGPVAEQLSLWNKTLHITSGAARSFILQQGLVNECKAALGSEIKLWGLQMLEVEPGKAECWHSDVEHVKWSGVSLWCALRYTSSASTLKVIPGSQRYGVSIQELGLDYAKLFDDEIVIKAAQKFDPEARVKTLDIAPGEYVIFDGPIWHRGTNESDKTRSVLLGQFCRPDVSIMIPRDYAIPTNWYKNKAICARSIYGDNWELDFDF